MADQPPSALALFTEFFSVGHIEAVARGAVARQTGFVQRTSNITGKIFLALVAFWEWSVMSMRRGGRAVKHGRALSHRCVTHPSLILEHSCGVLISRSSPSYSVPGPPCADWPVPYSMPMV
jgi:hypothetical protein